MSPNAKKRRAQRRKEARSKELGTAAASQSPPDSKEDSLEKQNEGDFETAFVSTEPIVDSPKEVILSENTKVSDVLDRGKENESGNEEISSSCPSPTVAGTPKNDQAIQNVPDGPDIVWAESSTCLLEGEKTTEMLKDDPAIQNEADCVGVLSAGLTGHMQQNVPILQNEVVETTAVLVEPNADLTDDESTAETPQVSLYRFAQYSENETKENVGQLSLVTGISSSSPTQILAETEETSPADETDTVEKDKDAEMNQEQAMVTLDKENTELNKAENVVTEAFKFNQDPEVNQEPAVVTLSKENTELNRAANDGTEAAKLNEEDAEAEVNQEPAVVTLNKESNDYKVAAKLNEEDPEVNQKPTVVTVTLSKENTELKKAENDDTEKLNVEDAETNQDVVTLKDVDKVVKNQEAEVTKDLEDLSEVVEDDTMKNQEVAIAKDLDDLEDPSEVVEDDTMKNLEVAIAKDLDAVKKNDEHITPIEERAVVANVEDKPVSGEEITSYASVQLQQIKEIAEAGLKMVDHVKKLAEAAFKIADEVRTMTETQLQMADNVAHLFQKVLNHANAVQNA